MMEQCGRGTSRRRRVILYSKATQGNHPPIITFQMDLWISGGEECLVHKFRGWNIASVGHRGKDHWKLTCRRENVK